MTRCPCPTTWPSSANLKDVVVFDVFQKRELEITVWFPVISNSWSNFSGTVQPIAHRDKGEDDTPFSGFSKSCWEGCYLILKHCRHSSSRLWYVADQIKEIQPFGCRQVMICGFQRFRWYQSCFAAVWSAPESDLIQKRSENDETPGTT